MAKINTSTMETVPLTAGQRTSVQIRKKFLDSAFLLNVRGALAVAGGTGAGAILDNATARLLRGIEVRGGQGARLSLRGLSLAMLNKLLERGGYDQDEPASLAAGANDAFSGWLKVPFSMPHSSRPYEFNFNSLGVSAPTLLIDVGTGADITDGNEDGALTFPGLEVEVIEEAIMQPSPGEVGNGRLVIRQTYIDVAQSANGRKLYLDEVGLGGEIRGIMLEGMSGGAGEVGYVYDNGVITAVALVIDGGYALERTSFGAIRQRNKNVYQLATPLTGVALIDAAEDFATGRGQLYTVTRDQRPYLELDLVPQGAGDNRVLVTYLIAER